MSVIKSIEKFIERRPEVIAAYGYGSGVFRQAGYDSGDNPQLDLIFIVDDIKRWNLDNIKMNPNDYSKGGMRFFKKSKREKLIGKTGVTYLSNILEDGCTFKYGVVDYKHFKEALSTWMSFYMTGRFQKTIMEFKSTKEVRELIMDNRRSAIIVAMLMSDDEVSIKDLLVRLCGLSYAGDTRMAIAENPRKVLNIVEGSYDEFMKIYESIIEEYAKIKKDMLEIKRDSVIDDFEDIPDSLRSYIEQRNVSLSDRNELESVIMEYLSNINKSESTQQTVKGLRTNGVSRSLSYAMAKVKKRFKK